MRTEHVEILSILKSVCEKSVGENRVGEKRVGEKFV